MYLVMFIHKQNVKYDMIYFFISTVDALFYYIPRGITLSCQNPMFYF